MHISWRLLPVLAGGLVFATSAGAQSLRQELKDIEIAPHWIYDDLPRARAEARKTGMPLLVVLRCVPCPPGRTLDGQVMRPQPDLEELEKQFVCVRVVQTNGLDLKTFNYDYDQSWACMILNADGTIYGRYGTRAGRAGASDAYLTVPSFRKALEKALELHRAYPANRDQLAGKTGKDVEYPRPETIPSLRDRPASATNRKQCIHCHMIREHILRTHWEENRLTREDLFVFPMPDRIGLQMDRDDGLRVRSVVADSPAGRAGFQAGDELLTMNGHPLISLADIQWVLHNSPAETELRATLRRDGQTMEKTIALSGNWKEGDLSWRASSWYGLRQGLHLEPLTAEDRKRRGLSDDEMAFVVRNLYGRSGPVLRKFGVQPGDVIVGIDGKSQAMTETEFLLALRLNHGPRDRVRFTILRDGRRREVSVPMW